MTEYDDDFFLKIAKSATRCFDPDDSPNGELPAYTALGLSIFVSWLFSTRLYRNSARKAIIGACCRELEREFSPQRLGRVQNEIVRQPEFMALIPEPLVDSAPYLTLTLEILGSTAVKMCPDLERKFLREMPEFVLEEYTVKRVRQFQSIATTVH